MELLNNTNVDVKITQVTELLSRFVCHMLRGTFEKKCTLKLPAG